MKMRVDLRQLVEDCLRKLALLKVEEPIISQDETPAGLLVGVVLVVFAVVVRVRDLIDFPEDHDLAVLANYGPIRQARSLASWSATRARRIWSPKGGKD
jgi:hypothetical protein